MKKALVCVLILLITGGAVYGLSGRETEAGASGTSDARAAPGAPSSSGAAAPGAQRAPDTQEVRDALGRTILLPGIPSRIVVAGRAVISIVDALLLFPGAKDRIAGAGVTDQGMGDFYLAMDPSAAQKTRFGNNAGPEQIAAVKPDLVILKTYMKESLGSPLERIGIPVLYLDLESPDSFARDVSTLGAVLGQTGRAREIIDWYDARVEAVRRAVRAPDPTVLVIQYTASGGDVSFMVPSAGWIQTRMVEAAGGYPVWTSAAGAGWSRVGIEQIAAWDPDFILVVSYRTPAADAVRELAASPQWRSLRAAREGRLLAFPADFYSWDQADTRWILGLQWLFTAIHDTPDPLNAAREFYAGMYGMSRSVFESLIVPRIRK